MKNSRFKPYLLLMAVKVAVIGAFLLSTSSNSSEVKEVKEPNTHKLQLGIEILLEDLSALEGKKVGVVANKTSQIRKTHLVDTLLSRGINLLTIFAPEHGFRGDHSAGATVENGKDIKTGLPIISLYGNNKKPKPEQIENLDVILFDIQDVGARFYTYISTLHYVMEAAAEQGKKVLVLDRPNPHGKKIDGPILDTAFKSFVGMHQVPVLHGLTIGEYGKMVNEEGWLKKAIRCNYEVVQMKNYNLQMHYRLPIEPSPNLPNDTAVQLYPSLCFFEGTIVSVGRGTPHPFQLIGFPGYKGSYYFIPESIPGKAEWPVYKDEDCVGDLLFSSYESRLKEGGLELKWLLHMHKSYSGKRPFFISFFDKLAGTDQLRLQIEQGMSQEAIKATWKDGLTTYQTLHKKYWLYPR